MASPVGEGLKKTKNKNKQKQTKQKQSEKVWRKGEKRELKAVKI